MHFVAVVCQAVLVVLQLVFVNKRADSLGHQVVELLKLGGGGKL